MANTEQLSLRNQEGSKGNLGPSTDTGGPDLQNPNAKIDATKASPGQDSSIGKAGIGPMPGEKLGENDDDLDAFDIDIEFDEDEDDFEDLDDLDETDEDDA